METKIKLMDSAFRLFAEKGTEFSLNEVASEVGIQKASIYAHFKSKEDLLNAVIEREIDAYFFEIEENCATLESLFFKVFDYYGRSKTKLYFWKRLLLFPPKAFEGTLIAKIRTLSEERFAAVKKIAEAEAGNSEVFDGDAAAMTFLSLIHGILSCSIIYESDDFAGKYRQIWQVIRSGLH